MIYDFKDKKKLIAIGDIHGCLDTIESMSSFRSKWLKDAVVVVCGDVGLGFRDFQIDRLTKIGELFGATNSVLLFVRGNHDDPSYYGTDKIQIDNVFAIEDYSVINTAHLSTIAIGGAISVDRMWRLQEEAKRNKYKSAQSKHLTKLYWENEQVVFDYNKLKKAVEENGKIDSVISHTTVSFAPPYMKDTSLNWFRIDSHLRDDLHTERRTMDQIYQCLTLDLEQTLLCWVYGHFHASYYTNIGECYFIGLNEHEIVDITEKIKIGEKDDFSVMLRNSLGGRANELNMAVEVPVVMQNEEIEQMDDPNY